MDALERVGINGAGLAALAEEISADIALADKMLDVRAGDGEVLYGGGVFLCQGFATGYQGADRADQLLGGRDDGAGLGQPEEL